MKILVFSGLLGLGTIIDGTWDLESGCMTAGTGMYHAVGHQDNANGSEK